VFQGASKLALDDKKRLSIPTRHREALAALCEGRLTLTRHPDGCVLIYPRPEWEKKREALAAMSGRARVLPRIMLGSAMDVEIDSTGRILISPELRAVAGIEREVMLLGMGERFELWEPQRLEAFEREHLAHGLPDAAADFVF
jgi:MraZ protein